MMSSEQKQTALIEISKILREELGKIIRLNEDSIVQINIHHMDLNEIPGKTKSIPETGGEFLQIDAENRDQIVMFKKRQ